MGGVSMVLSDLVDVIGGGTPKTTEESYWNGSIPWLSVKDFCGDKKYVYNTEKSITVEGLNNSSTKLLHKDNIIISARGTVGELAMIPYDMAFNQSCFGLIPKGNNDPHFVYYLLKDKVRSLKSQTQGSVFDTITKATFDRIECADYSEEDQRRIASILSSLDRKIELNNKINADLEEMAQAIFKNWFVDFEPFKDGKFVDSELGMIPEGWKVGTLEDLITIKYGKDHKKLEDGTFPVYGSGGLMRFVNSWLYNGESVLIPRKGTLDNIMYVCEKFWTVDTMFFSVPKMDYVMKYVYNYIKRFDFSKMNEGTSVPSNTAARLNKMQILIPTHEVLEMYDETLCPIYNKRKMNDKESRTLSLLRDTLLPRLMSGELEVPE